MPSCSIRQVYDAASKCWVTRCIDGISPNRKHYQCYDYTAGKGAVIAPSDLPVIVAAPGVGLFTPLIKQCVSNTGGLGDGAGY